MKNLLKRLNYGVVLGGNENVQFEIVVQKHLFFLGTYSYEKGFKGIKLGKNKCNLYN